MQTRLPMMNFYIFFVCNEKPKIDTSDIIKGFLSSTTQNHYIDTHKKRLRGEALLAFQQPSSEVTLQNFDVL